MNNNYKNDKGHITFGVPSPLAEDFKSTKDSETLQEKYATKKVWVLLFGTEQSMCGCADERIAGVYISEEKAKFAKNEKELDLLKRNYNHSTRKHWYFIDSWDIE
jgi:hypothetical protein